MCSPAAKSVGGGPASETAASVHVFAVAVVLWWQNDDTNQKNQFGLARSSHGTFRLLPRCPSAVNRSGGGGGGSR